MGTFTGNLGAGLLQEGLDDSQSKGKPSKTGFSVPKPSTRLRQLEEQLVESPYSMSSLIQDYAPDYASEQMDALDRSLMALFSATSTSSAGRDSSNPISSNSNKRPSTSSNQSNFWKPETRSQTEKSAVHRDLQSRNQRHVEDQSWISKEWNELTHYHQQVQMDRQQAEGHPLSTLVGMGKEAGNILIDTASFLTSTGLGLMLPPGMSSVLHPIFPSSSSLPHFHLAPTERYGADVMDLLSLSVGAVDGVGELNLLSRGAGLFGRSTWSESALTRERVMGNVSQNRVANASSNYVVLEAKQDQILSGYRPDIWGMTNLSKGDIVFGGLPGQSKYYTDLKTVLASGGNRNALYKSLQIRPDPNFGYRPFMGKYEVVTNPRVPEGIVSANPEFGVGSAKQYYISDYSSTLRLIERIELRENHEYTLSPYKPGR